MKATPCICQGYPQFSPLDTCPVDNGIHASIGCGCADANNAARLGADPMHMMLLVRYPVWGWKLPLGKQTKTCRRRPLAADIVAL